MEPWTRVLLYGTYNGFSRSTDGIDNMFLVLDGGEKVEVPKEFVISADQMVNKNKIKLKDVIKRIEKFDLGTKVVWINEILNKLGSDYGLHKYYAGYKQGKFDGAMEREKVTVPQFVADWIEKAKKELSMREAMSQGYAPHEVDSWLREMDQDGACLNQEIFARAWLDGYTVEKDRRYTVKMTATKQPLFYNNLDERLFFSLGELATKFTRKQLEQSGFGWVFDCPGIEIEEVEE